MTARVTAFVYSVALAAGASLYALVTVEPSIDRAHASGALLLAALGALTHFFNYKIAERASGTSAFVPCLAAIVVYPSWFTVVAISLGAAIVEASGARLPVKKLFNISQQLLALSLSALVYRQTGALPIGVQEGFHLWQQLALLLTFLVTNSIAVATVIGLSENRPLFRVWATTTLPSLSFDLLALPFVYSFAVVYAHFGIQGLSVIAISLYGANRLYKQNSQVAEQNLKVEEQNRRLELTNEQMLELMVKTVEYRDKYTKGHSERVAEKSGYIARACQLSEDVRRRLRGAAMLHDVGKIHHEFESLLSKEGPLTPSERATMQLHPALGEALCSSLSELQDVLPAIRHHHENWDGSGYPDQRAGEDIPLASRIIAIADTVDAMTTNRPYRAALTRDEVTRELERCSGTQFDPDIVTKLLASPYYDRLFDYSENSNDHSGTKASQSDESALLCLNKVA